MAPGSAFSYQGKLTNVRVPTLIVVGENDGHGSSVVLKEIPTSSDLQIIPNAGHPAYLDDPDRWHKLLHNFMGLVQSKYCYLLPLSGGILVLNGIFCLFLASLSESGGDSVSIPSSGPKIVKPNLSVESSCSLVPASSLFLFVSIIPLVPLWLL